MINRFKKPNNKKKWEEDLEQDQDMTIFQSYIPPKDQLIEPQNKPQTQQDPQQQQTKLDQHKLRKNKEYEWMSDSDLDQPKQTLQQNKVQKQIKQEGYIDLFVSKIPHKASEDDVTKYLEKYGTVKDIFMPVVEGTDIHKGKAFVQFIPKDPNFLQISQHKLRGSTIIISNKILFNKRKEESQSDSSDRSRSRSRQQK